MASPTKTYPCGLCRDVFATSKDLRNHIYAAHYTAPSSSGQTPSLPPLSVALPPRTTRCPLCGYSFANASNLVRHVRQVSLRKNGLRLTQCWLVTHSMLAVDADS